MTARSMENKKKLLTKTLEYAGVPSLKHQALLKVTVLLWNHESILYEPWKSFDDTARRCLGQKSSLVEYRINTLPLPVLLKNELSRFNAGIYLEIFKWNEYQLDKYGLEIIIPKPLCWKLSGTINYKKTAELLIQDSRIDIFPRFFLACMYGLEDSIKKLWRSLPQECRNTLLYSDIDFIFYWANNLTECDPEGLVEQEIIRLFNEDLPQTVFLASIRMCDTPVSEYMFEKLRPEDKLVLTYLFEETAKTICESYPSHSKTKFVYPDVLCWLLHKLDEQERERMFVLHSFPVLLCYLEWPKQESFMEMAKCLLKFLSTKHFGYILKEIAFKMTYFEDFNYRKLFREFWQQGLEPHKKYAVGASSCWCALYYLFMVGDVQNIRMIFSRANDAQKRRFSKSRWGSQILEYLQYMGEKDLCNCFIKNCLPAKNISHSQ